MNNSIYLDYNSTAPLFESSKNAMIEAMDLVGNASSIHHMGQKVRGLVEKSRRNIALHLGVNPEQIVFTSCATEAMNMVIKAQDWDKIIYSAAEHPATKETAESLKVDLFKVPCNKNAALDLNVLETVLKKSQDQKQKTLVSLMYVNNVFGTIFPVREVANLCQQYGAVFHCDIVQAVGRIPVKCDEIGADYYSLSAHKFGGPKGIGALIMRETMHPKPFIHGGGQEKYYRAGTENIIGIAGMAVALDEAVRRFDAFEAQRIYRDQMEAEILEKVPEAIIIAKNSKRMPNTSCVMVPNQSAEKILIAMDLKGICLSSGSACSSGKTKAVTFLEEMGYDKKYVGSVMRISSGWDSTQDELLNTAKAYINFVV